LEELLYILKRKNDQRMGRIEDNAGHSCTICPNKKFSALPKRSQFGLSRWKQIPQVSELFDGDLTQIYAE
jgi:hypothetical protein